MIIVLLSLSLVVFSPMFINAKGDWGKEIWSLGLLPTGSKSLAEVGRPLGCAGRIKFAVTSGQKGDVKSDARVKRVPRSLHVKNPCNNSLRGP